MQLKLKRSQRQGGLTGSTAIFCLDARAEFTPQEQQSLSRYKLMGEVIYNSEASRSYLERSEAHRRDGSTGGAFKSLAMTAMAAMRLNITVASLARGQHIECKSLDEMIAAENALYVACENLKSYLDKAASFDGREIVVTFDSTEDENQVAVSGVRSTPQNKVVEQPQPTMGYDAPNEEPPAQTLQYANTGGEQEYEPGGSYGSNALSPAQLWRDIMHTWSGLTNPMRIAVIVGAVILLIIIF